MIEQSRDDADENWLLRAHVYLLATDSLLTEWCRLQQIYFTLCGQAIIDLDLPHATCEDDDCECEVLYYCPKCIREAIHWNAEIERDAGVVATGWIMRDQPSSHLVMRP